MKLLPISLFSAALLVLLCAGCASSHDRRVILPPGAQSGGRYSPGILADETLYISGMGGEDENERVPSDFPTEVLLALNKIDAVLKAAGMTPNNVVSVQVYLTDANDFQQMNAVYTTFFKAPRPTRTTVVVSKLVVPGRIEITATARK